MQPWGQNVFVYRLSPEWYIGDVFLHKSLDKKPSTEHCRKFSRISSISTFKEREKSRWGIYLSFLLIGTSTRCVRDCLICMFNSHHPLVHEHLSSNRKFTINITSVLDRWIIFSNAEFLSWNDIERRSYCAVMDRLVPKSPLSSKNICQERKCKCERVLCHLRLYPSSFIIVKEDTIPQREKV